LPGKGLRPAGPEGDIVQLKPLEQEPVSSRPLTEFTDDELMLAARGGVDAAFDALVRRHQAVAIRVAHKFLGEPGLALDAAQGAFLEVLRSLPRYQAQGRFVGYLFRILINQCKMLRRSSSRGQRSLVELAIIQGQATAEQPEAQVIARERRRDVQRALERLNRKTRSILILRFAGELSYKDIAEVLGMPIGTVKSRIASGIEELRGLIHGELS
jgi:RNA polymerase sigma-70 factor (ECF subfamily)